MFKTVLNTVPLINQVGLSSTRVIENLSNYINHNSEKVISRVENPGKILEISEKASVSKVCHKFTIDQLFENTKNV